ncbi:MAG: hypothetical protein AAGF97_07660 [Planctomycetota bacterium]
MKNRKIAAAVVILVLLGVGAVWWLSGSAERKVARATQEFAQNIDAQDPDSPGVIQIEGDAMEDLDEAQMQEVAKNVTPNLMKMVYDRYQRVLELPPDQQREELDRTIDESLASRDQPTGLPPGTSGTMVQSRVARRGPDGELTEQESSEVVDGSTPEGQRFMLDHTTPEQRAIMEAYVSLLRDRMIERGIDPTGVPIKVGISIQQGQEYHAPS